MKIAIIGAGFTGLTAGLRLAQKGHSVHIFEKEEDVGGLAVGFKHPKWKWTLEKSYHHWFTNDANILSLAKELGQEVITKRPHTDILIEDKVLTFDSISSLLSFSNLSLPSRFRMGLVLAYLKLLNNYKKLENKLALEWLEKCMGKDTTRLIWEPLFSGKFGEYKNSIILSWFWARIKKRTASLAYPEKGFKNFAEKIAKEIVNLGGKFYFNCEIQSVNSNRGKCIIKTTDRQLKFDKIVCTSPTPTFVKLTSKLPKKYIERISSINHLHAMNLILVSKKPFLKNTYWLNITNKNFPFLVLVEHTNFMDKIHYNNEHILYIGTYLPTTHPYLKMSQEQLIKVFMPYLLRLNQNFKKNLIRTYKFIGPFAQPIVRRGYSKLIPEFVTPLKNIYLANLDMVYPWDRGTNYAVDLGEKIAKFLPID